MRRTSPFDRDPPPDDATRIRDEEPPPLLGSWTAWYVLVMVSLLFWIGMFYLFTRWLGE